jgi:opacity protein-like surface antigen
MSAFIGANVIRDTNVTSESFTNDSYELFSDNVEFDTGLNLGMTGGFNFGYFRLEGELSYKGAELKGISDNFGVSRYRNVDGDISMLALMLNGFFDLRNNTPVTPYFGGGVGVATVYLDDTYATTTTGGETTRLQIYNNDSDSAFAYQIGGGLEIALNRVLSLDLGYRYFGTTEFELDGDHHDYWDNWGTNSEFKLKSHNVNLGLRVNF